MKSLFFYAEWTQEAACRAMDDPDIFFASDPKTDFPKAKEICERCPVIRDCARELWDDQWSVVAGLTPRERKKLDSSLRNALDSLS